jgi:hypothetical protein
MTGKQEGFTNEKLFIFLVRNGLARLLMAALLIICYMRAICEKQHLWILAKFCYAALLVLSIDWWIILLKIHVHRQLVEYFWINTGVAIFILCRRERQTDKSVETIEILVTIPPLWFLRHAYFVRAAKDSKLQAKTATRNLQSYVHECWDLKEKQLLDSVEMHLAPADRMISTVGSRQDNCEQQNETMLAEDWCTYGVCLLKQMPDDVLEQVVVLSTICVRW